MTISKALMFYQLLAENTRAIVLFLRADGRIIEANRAAAEAYGIERHALVGLSYADLEAGPTAGAQLQTLFGAEPGRSVTLYTVHRRAGGRNFPVEVTGSVGEIGGSAVLLCMVRDVTAPRRRAATQELLHALDHLILQKQPLEVILQHLCSELSGLFNSPLVWVGLKQPGGSITVGASAGECAPLLDQHDLRWNGGPGGGTMASLAIRTGRPQLGDLREMGREILLSRQSSEHGLMEVFAAPLIAGGETLGAMVLNTADQGAFDAEIQGVLTALADQVSISVLAARDQEQIRLQTTALEAAANTVVITDRNGTILWVNPAWTRLTGYSREEAVGQTPRILKSGQHSDSYYALLWETVLAGRNWRGEIENRRKDGSFYVDEQTITPVRGAQGEITHFIAIKQDVTDRKWHEEQLRHLAMHDPLTGLPNRRGLKEELERLAAKAGRGEHGALLLVDLDNFKRVNDSQGHPAGDRLLVTLGTLLRRVLRPGDLLARLGGDEFAVLLEGTGPEEAQKVAGRLRKVVSEYNCRIDGHPFELSVSIGIAQVDGTLTPDGVMALADAALYGAKDQGKNRAVLYRVGDDRSERKEERRWATRIKAALRENRFALYLQPVIRLSTGTPEHYEALIRMTDEDGQIIAPVHFLPAAERFGLMPQIDRWVMNQVLPVLIQNPDLKIFVNLNGQSLGDRGLLAHIEERIREARVEAGRLCLEITETVAVRNLDLVQAWMERLQMLGCQFALDDFGTGFSSFAYLRRLPADYVKFDGSFIRDLDRDPTSLSLVEAMKTLCHTLGKQVIAEWVETEAVAGLLRELGVEFGQGFHWGYPEPALLACDQTDLAAD